MRVPRRLLAALLTFGISSVNTAAARATPVVIDFDDRPGFPGPFGQGTPVPPQFLINDEYLPLGVLFDSTGGGICIAQTSTAISGPNAANATGAGPTISYLDPVTATFWVNGTPGTVDLVSLTLIRHSGPTRLWAFDLGGTFLGQAMGEGLQTLTVNAPGLIHSIRIVQDNPMGFDDLTFSGLVPEPGSLGLFVVAFAVTHLHRRNS